MERKPRWTISECEAVLSAARVDPETVWDSCPRRSRSAVDTLVADLHRLHLGLRPRSLSRMLQQHVATRRGALSCPRCGSAW
ncbi:MAG TPA: hypothetical protein VFE37_16995 [Chloroflexota bacterium]|nr:hypothetical protein [Chloroflexota bacterium]